jgi:capsular polysaccharide biosynthesis protein
VNDNPISLAMLGRLVRHRWPALLVLVALGGALGATSSFVLSPGYVSTSKVLLQGSRDATQLAGETQVATSLTVLDRVAADLGWATTGIELQRSVSATVDSNVLSINGAAATPQRAQQLTAAVTVEYGKFSSQIATETADATAAASKQSRQEAQQLLDDANNRVTELQGSPALGSTGPDGVAARTELDAAKSAVADATQRLNQINKAAGNTELAAVGQGSMRIIEAATLPDGPASPTMPELIVGGAAALLLIGIVLHLLALRTDRRLREPADIAAAIGARLLEEVVVHVPRQHSSVVARILRDDRQWVLPDSAVSDTDGGRDSRCRRVLSRLGAGAAPRTLLVAVPDGDRAAGLAVVELAVAAAGWGAVAVTTEDQVLVEAVHAAAAAAGVSNVVLAGGDPAPPETPTVLRIVEVSAAHPMILDGDPSDGALVVASVNAHTGWELSVLAGSVSDAGHAVGGVLVAQPRLAPSSHPRDEAPPDEPVAADGDAAMVGPA